MKTELTLNVLQTMSAQEYEDIRAAGSDERRELTHAVMRQQSHRLPVNSLNERVIFRKSECGQRAGIWAMMCPALEAFCLMT